MTQDRKSPNPSRETLPEDLYRAGLTVTWVGMIINILLVGLKLFGGIVGASTAMVADGLHSLSDLLTDFGVIIGLKFMTKPADTSHAYGHGRVETAISLLMGLLIILTGLGLLQAAGGELADAVRGTFPVRPGLIALVMGIVSLISKEGLFHYTRHVARRTGSKTLEANAWHHRSDAFSSVGTVLGVGGAIILGNRWTVLDPIAAGAVSLLVIRIGVNIGWRAFRELSDESLSQKACNQVEESIRRVEGVRDFHHIRTRALGRYVSVEAHILVDPDITVTEGHAIATQVEESVRDELENAAFVTIHVEPARRTVST